MRIFVYGTLKRGFCRHQFLKGERFLGEVRTAPRYRMFNIGTYPGLVEDPENGRSILGELYDVSPQGVEGLDVVEAVDEGEYLRRPIQLDPPDVEPVEAYFYQLPVEHLPDCGECWT